MGAIDIVILTGLADSMPWYRVLSHVLWRRRLGQSDRRHIEEEESHSTL